MDCFEWVPPSNANYNNNVFVTEMNEDEENRLARRRRADLASKHIGDYLLRGYTMLASVCPMCDSVLMKKGDGEAFCVACEKLGFETGEKKKKAGSSDHDDDYKKKKKKSNDKKPTMDVDDGSDEAIATETTTTRKKTTETTMETETNDPITTTTKIKTTETGRRILHGDDEDVVIDRVLTLVSTKMADVGDKLSKSEDVDLCTDSLRVIKACAECLVALKKAKKA